MYISPEKRDYKVLSEAVKTYLQVFHQEPEGSYANGTEDVLREVVKTLFIWDFVADTVLGQIIDWL